MDVTIIDSEGYDDGYYWDFRIWFRYKGADYTYINVGSCSGYIPHCISIKNGLWELPKGIRDDSCESDFGIHESELIDAVDALIASGEDECILVEED